MNGNNVNGILYKPTVPSVGCKNTDGGTGKVGFTATVDLCCLP
jgi:hypothetical protein